MAGRSFFHEKDLRENKKIKKEFSTNMKEYLRSSAEVIEEVASSTDGLTAAEAASRLEKNGKNKLAEGKQESLIVTVFKQSEGKPFPPILKAACRAYDHYSHSRCSNLPWSCNL